MTGNKINWQDLAAELATRTGMQRRDAETFVRSFFDTLGQAIIDEKSVKIKTLGTFKMVEVQERESVNVNTGERFTISGHVKIGFLPDNALKELVNKPFADFQTVVLNEKTTAEDMEKIDKKYEAYVSESEEEEEEGSNEATSSYEAETAKEVASEPTIQQEEEKEDNKPTSDSLPTAIGENPSQPPTEDNSCQLPKEEEKAEDKAEDKAEEIVVVAKEEEVKEPCTQKEPETPSEEADSTSIHSQKPQNTAQDTPSCQAMQSEKVVYTPKEPEYSRIPQHNIWRTLFLALVSILIMIACYMIGYLRLINMSWLCMPPAEELSEQPVIPLPIEQTTTGTSDTDTSVTKQATDASYAKSPETPDKEKTVKQADPTNTPAKESTHESTTQKETKTDNRNKLLQAAKNYPQVEGGKYLITGVLKTRVMKHGENLYRIAHQEYGRKSAVEYIKVLNKLSNPDTIPIGYEIKLPRLVLKEE